MKSSTKQTRTSPVLWGGLGLLAILLVVFVVLITQTNTQTAGTPNPNITDLQVDSHVTGYPSEEGEEKPGGSEKNTQTIALQKEENQKASHKNGNGNTETKPTQRGFEEPGVPLLQACVGTSFCDINQAQDILAALGRENEDAELFVDGALVKPKNIKLQLNQNNYSEDILADVSGKPLLSTDKEYFPTTQELHIKIGMNLQYYASISSKERHTLYLEQVVRSFMAMLQQNPNDFITAQQAVLFLNSWTPANP